MFYQVQKNKLILSVRVSPNAHRAGIEGIWNDTHLKIALTAPPVDGKANECLIEFLSDYFSIRKSAITIQSGQTGRQKRLLLTFETEAHISSALTRLQQDTLLIKQVKSCGDLPSSIIKQSRRTHTIFPIGSCFRTTLSPISISGSICLDINFIISTASAHIPPKSAGTIRHTPVIIPFNMAA